ncbi:PI-stichotoxin-She2b [Haematobia irritans]|uniref:PI-stichotoxin-She2b n=1 Tax=Haematobia irritans TaxID=7368 RepID=UPI003F4F831E
MKLTTTLLILAMVQVFLWPPTMVLATESKPNSTACLEPKAPGLCRGKILRYAFDNKSGNCISFYYSGCGATLNNFLTYEECRRDCMKRLRY